MVTLTQLTGRRWRMRSVGGSCRRQMHAKRGFSEAGCGSRSKSSVEPKGGRVGHPTLSKRECRSLRRPEQPSMRRACCVCAVLFSQLLTQMMPPPHQRRLRRVAVPPSSPSDGRGGAWAARVASELVDASQAVRRPPRGRASQPARVRAGVRRARALARALVSTPGSGVSAQVGGRLQQK